MRQQTIKIDGVELNIHYELDGMYLPETPFTPAEYPEVIIKQITADGDISALITDDVDSEILQRLEVA